MLRATPETPPMEGVRLNRGLDWPTPHELSQVGLSATDFLESGFRFMFDTEFCRVASVYD